MDILCVVSTSLCLEPVLQLLLFHVVLSIRVGSDDGSEEENSADPILRDLVVDLLRQILP